MARNTIKLDSDMRDRSLEEFAKLKLPLNKDPKKIRRERSTVKKIQDIWDAIQDSVLFAKLKKEGGRVYCRSVKMIFKWI